MRLRALVVVAGLLWPASVFSQAGIVGGVKGKDLLEKCAEAKDSVQRNFCSGYIEGVIDASQTYAHSLHKKSRLCVPASVDQSIDTVMNYLRAHPDEQHYSASSEAWLALIKAFPCNPAEANPAAANPAEANPAEANPKKP